MKITYKILDDRGVLGWGPLTLEEAEGEAWVKGMETQKCWGENYKIIREPAEVSAGGFWERFKKAWLP